MKAKPCPIEPLESGLHPNLSMSDYLADPCRQPSLSASTIRKMWDQSPLHAKLWHSRLGGKSESSRRADLGSAAHAMALEGPGAIGVVKADSYRTKQARADRDELREAGKIPVLEHEEGQVLAMAASAKKALASYGAGESEVTAVWQEANGVWGRQRPDFLTREYVIDLKTTTNADPDSWIRSTLFRGGYDISAAWYLRGLEALGQAPRQYLFLAQEIDEPYECSFVGAPEELLDNARKINDWAVRTWGRCLSCGVWPGYDKRIHWADVPAWRSEQIDDRMMMEEFDDEDSGRGASAFAGFSEDSEEVMNVL